jgi:hypothetical protein
LLAVGVGIFWQVTSDDRIANLAEYLCDFICSNRCRFGGGRSRTSCFVECRSARVLFVHIVARADYSRLIAFASGGEWLIKWFDCLLKFKKNDRRKEIEDLKAQPTG